jgi:hypothetical protein
MISGGKKLHHYVPRFYLRAWAKTQQVYCLQEGRIFLSNVKNVCAENYFYRLEKLTTDDITLVKRLFVENSGDSMKEYLDRFIHVFTLPHNTEQEILQTESPDFEYLGVIKQLINEMNEDIHTSIEKQFQPYLFSLLKGDLSFLSDARQASNFLYTLAIQYARTNHILRAKPVITKEHFETLSRLGNLITHIIAALLGRSLYVDRNRLTILLVDNTSDNPFITSDQPIINIAANPRDFAPPKSFELYYPLSPKKAMLILEPDSTFHPSSTSLTANEAHMYNLRLASYAKKQIFSLCPKQLEAIKEQLPAYLSCFPPEQESF